MRKVQIVILAVLFMVITEAAAQDGAFKNADITNSIEIEGDINFAWTCISNLGNLQYLVPSTIKKSELTGNGKGSIVTLTLANNGIIVEEVVKLDNKQRHITYTMISTPLPIKDYKASFRVIPLADNRFEVVFEAKFKVQDVHRKARMDLFNTLQLEFLENIKKKTYENR